MLEFEVGYRDVRHVEAWCLKHISSRIFYIHTSQGGEGWRIKKSSTGNYLIAIEDDKAAIMAMLKFGK